MPEGLPPDMQGLPPSPNVDQGKAAAERDRGLARLFNALAKLADEATEFVKLALAAEHQNPRRRP